LRPPSHRSTRDRRRHSRRHARHRRLRAGGHPRVQITKVYYNSPGPTPGPPPASTPNGCA
jgi:hypothetical protein